MKNETTKNTGNVILAIIVTALLIGVLILAIAIVYPALNSAQVAANGITYTSVTTQNETGFANGTGYTVSGASLTGFTQSSLVIVYNRSNNTPIFISSGNFTFTSGVLKNSTSKVFNNLSITYSYKYDTSSTAPFGSATESIFQNILGTVSNFFALMPTIGTIFAVVILIGGIVLLVFYVKRMRDSGQHTDYYTG